jgi:hypothetical protein
MIIGHLVIYLQILLGISNPLIFEPRAIIARKNEQLELQLAQQRKDLGPLVQAWLKSTDLDLTISPDPLNHLFADLNNLGDEERRVHLDVVQYQGQLWGWEAECKVFGHVYAHEGAFVEFADSNYTLQAMLTLSNLTPSWIPGRGLQLRAQADALAQLGMLRGNRYPCIGGGITLKGGPATCDASVTTTATAVIDGIQQGGIIFHVDATTSQIPVNCSISLGSLGTLRIGQIIPDTNASFSGSFSLPLAGSGVLNIPLPSGNVEKSYTFSLLSPKLDVTTSGLHAATNLHVDWK